MVMEKEMRYKAKVWCMWVLVMALACLRQLSAYNTATVNGITWYYEVQDRAVSIGYYDSDWEGYRPAISTSTSGHITIPSSLGGYPVTSIDDSAFYGCSGLTSVAIPNSVTSIGGSAFYACRGLTSVTIPNSVRSIEQYAFDLCNRLKDVVVPSRWPLSSIFPAAYSSSITNVVVLSGSKSIVNGAFKGCGALTGVTIPDTVTSIGDEAFYNCTSLLQLSIPDSVTSYGANCFEGCPAYTLNLYRAVFGGGVGGGSSLSVVTTVVQQVESPYSLTNAVADRAIASVTVDSDCAVDAFVLKDGKVYDSILYISNTADREVMLTMPSGYVYKAIKGARPLSIPANSQSILSITRVADNVFLVSREDLETIQ